MMKSFGTISRGVKTPIIKEGDDLVNIVCNSVLNATKKENIELQDRDIVAVTEAVVGIAEGNYATVDQIAKDIKNKFGDNPVGLVFPILSRNRFSMLLKGIARGAKKLIIQLSYPLDEVGNPLVNPEVIYESDVNPYKDVFTGEEFNKKFDHPLHPFTGMNYIDMYKELGGENCEIIVANKPEAILNYTKYVIAADIHTRHRTKKALENAGAEKVLTLCDILNESVDGSGYNSKYGLLGSNKSTEERVKLFPENGQKYVDAIHKKLKEATGKNIEVMIYGDGAFKDPVCGIWELADPVVSPAHTDGLLGTPNELKLKFLSDNKFKDLRGEELIKAMQQEIKNKNSNLKGTMATQGTTPRRYTDLLGSLCDLTSGSGDKGTPVVLIQNYFDTYAD
ncbi:MAG: coenzyme F420-0:L-glutamate ligase [Clostridia bacterium]|nr:coenzyme F420-0:L-glutamate ligase [Clostridia bacterium]